MRFIIIALVATLSLAAPAVKREDGKPGKGLINGKPFKCRGFKYTHKGITFCGEESAKMIQCMDDKEKKFREENKCDQIKKDDLGKSLNNKCFGADAEKEKRFTECKKETGAKSMESKSVSDE